MKRGGAAGVGLLFATALCAQSPPAVEVASIRVTPPKANRGGPQISGNRLTLTGNMNQLVMYAWELKPYQIRGGPAWVTSPSIETDYYDISVIAEGPEALTPARARLLLQSLLKERFRLNLHQEEIEMPVYWLVQAASGPKMQKGTSAAVCKPAFKVTAATVSAAFAGCTMDTLMRLLAGVADRPVLDRTALAGAWDFRLEFTRDPAAAAGDVPSLFTAVQEQLGLKLEPQKGPVDVFVIDSVERPAQN